VKKTLQKYILVICSLFSTIGCQSDNTINGEFIKIEFDINKSLLSAIPVTIENAFHVTYPVDFTEIDKTDFKMIKTAIESDSTSFFQLSPIAVYKSSGGSTSILSKIISEEEVFDKIDTTYYNVLANNFETRYIEQSKIKINGINTIQYIITTTEVVLIKLIFHVRDFYYQLDYIIPISIYEEKLKSIESSIGSIHKKKEFK